MIFGRHTSRRTRLRLALLAACALLMQQLALAAYACVADTASATAAHCAGMSTPPPSGTAALCSQACAQQTPAVPDARALRVPPDNLPALCPAALVSQPLAGMSPAPASCAAPHPSPPPRDLFCSRQI
ncbi:MAG: hypothetical protein JSS28_00020 [Proteobacteria bacterium]|nr:hypothetical protein [Pseudomonadota bacterium]